MSYLSEKVFVDNQVNTIADKLVYFLTEAFNIDYVDTDFCLTGSSAFILQDTERGEALNVVFATSNKDMYDYLAKNINKLVQPKNVIKFKERLLIEFDFAKMEIWKFSESITLVGYGKSSVKLQQKETIPENLL
ncbi:hypothetical protein [uncultured Flavobacterium sp.]|uniref:hypothetical protein n=1 Tax=uncultured Flavobacterium sp. TaxID=165435 RepID=UPI0030ED62FE|tara:strand:+ start:1712 stop:2113 length:402 start_codon:yes stop_codon:yes gene_type:complete